MNVRIGKKVHMTANGGGGYTICTIPFEDLEGWEYTKEPVTCLRCLMGMCREAMNDNTIARKEVIRAISQPLE